jgi:H+/gluconate symporter-like permease
MRGIYKIALTAFMGLALGFGALQPTPARAQSADQATYQQSLAAYNAQCSGVTSSNAALYQQCAAQKAKLDSQKQKFPSPQTDYVK